MKSGYSEDGRDQNKFVMDVTVNHSPVTLFRMQIQDPCEQSLIRIWVENQQSSKYIWGWIYQIHPHMAVRILDLSRIRFQNLCMHWKRIHTILFSLFQRRQCTRLRSHCRRLSEFRHIAVLRAPGILQSQLLKRYLLSCRISCIDPCTSCFVYP